MPGVEGTMEEFKAGTLHSGSKTGPKVTNPKQAIAIGLSEERKAGKPVPKKKGKAKPGSKEHRDRHIAKAIKKAHADYRARYGGHENPFNSQSY